MFCTIADFDIYACVFNQRKKITQNGEQIETEICRLSLLYD